ncbi:MAG: penicillin-binding transpeptidase domain-containing protein, partial [Gemmatimonadota bacterium]
NWTGVTQPYEPGSTLKPFTAAALLGLGRATLLDSVYAEEGRHEELKLTDVHGYGWLTLADALRFSSNIGLAKMGARLTPAEHYVLLRDFGFGSPTGVAYPSESAGRLPRPARWSRTSSSRLSIGYEISATPLQMAMAYGTLANGGELLLPRLVREVRSRDGRVERTVPRHVVRRVIPAEVAAALREVLTGAVQDGTGQGAALGSFTVAGKTGTARIAGSSGYIPGAYTASFAGFFPARDPQLVIIVKLDEPRGAYYGGETAAPVTRATLEAALAAHSTPIDRRPIARALRPLRPASAPVARMTSGAGRAGGSIERVQLRGRSSAAPIRSAAQDTAAAVPDVTGMPLRDGVRLLHSAGYRIRVEGGGRVQQTIPVAGTPRSADTVVRVIGGVDP